MSMKNKGRKNGKYRTNQHCTEHNWIIKSLRGKTTDQSNSTCNEGCYGWKCTLKHIKTGEVIAEGIGTCNSRESKYRYQFTASDKKQIRMKLKNWNRLPDQVG